MTRLLPTWPRALRARLPFPLTHRRLSYPSQSCVPAELCYVSLSTVHNNAAPVRNQTLSYRRHALKIPGVWGQSPQEFKRRRKFKIPPLDLIQDGRSPQPSPRSTGAREQQLFYLANLKSQILDLKFEISQIASNFKLSKVFSHVRS